mgnify:FL=1
MKLTKVFSKKNILIVALLTVFIGIYKSDLFMIQIPAKVQGLTQDRIKLWDATNAIMHFIDSINPFVGKMALESVANDVESINIIFTNKNARKFQKMKFKSYDKHSGITDKSLVENEFIRSE